MKLNRGGLSIPTGLTRTVCRYCYLVFSMLTAASSQDLFLKGTKSQRDALIQIAFNFLSRQCENLMSETCQRCLIPVSSLSKMLLKVCANTMLNGFQRKKNDEISRKKRRDNDSLQIKKFINYFTLCPHYCQRDCNDSDEKKLQLFQRKHELPVCAPFCRSQVALTSHTDTWPYLPRVTVNSN